MPAKKLQQRRDFLKTAAMGAIGISTVRFNKAFASQKAWTKVQINPAIDNARVICCHDTKMLPNYNASSTFKSQQDMVNAALVGANLDQMAMKLAQKTTAADAWSTIFRKPAAKAWSAVRVAMKTNGIGGPTTNRPRVAIYKKICDVLIDQLGVSASNIVLYDACDDPTQFYTSTYVSLTDSTKIRAVVSSRASGMGGFKAVTLANWVTSGSNGSPSCPADLLSGAIDILVNVAACKSHNGTGGSYNYGSCTLCMKNHFGTFTDDTVRHISHSDGLHVANSGATPPPAPLALFEINQHDAVLGGDPIRQQLCIVDALLSNGASGPGGGFDNRTDRLVMGTFAPIVDYLSAKNILLNTSVMTDKPIAALGVTHAATILPMFLSNFGYAEADVQNSWMEYIPGAIGVVDPSPREHSGRRVQVALSNSSYKQSVAHINVPQSAGAMRVSILDGRGRQIRKLSASHDQTRIVWDGLSDNGTQVSAGNYLVKISAGTVENAGIIVAGR